MAPKCDPEYLADSLHNGNYSEVKDALLNQCSKKQVLEFVEAYAGHAGSLERADTGLRLRKALEKTKDMLD